jgi:hypothetical protein
MLDGRANPYIGAVAADVPRHRRIDVGINWIGRCCEPRRGRHDLTRLAIAALDHSSHAFWTFAPTVVSPILSIVVMARSRTAPTASMQERTGLPPICTVQAPHWAIPRPNFVPVMPRMSRRTQSSGVAAGASNDFYSPLIVNFNMELPISSWFAKPQIGRGSGSSYVTTILPR